jgi:hypothetical protein
MYLTICDARKLAYGFGRWDGKVYNFTTEGWDVLDATAKPATKPLPSVPAALAAAKIGPDYYRPLKTIFSPAWLSPIQSADVPDVVSSTSGPFLILYSVDDAGVPSGVADVWPYQWLETAGVKGGMSR